MQTNTVFKQVAHKISQNFGKRKFHKNFGKFHKI